MAASFDCWLETVFDHNPGDPQWYWAPDFDERWDALGLTDAVTVAYLTRLFSEPECLELYKLEEVAQGIWFLVGEASPAQPAHALFNTEVPLQERVACIEAITAFFRKFVAPAAPGPAETDTDPFHIACYMWWDIFPCWGGTPTPEPEIHSACLRVMAQVLELSSDLCRISALHGLNHWHLHHARETEQIIDSFLQHATSLTPRVREYAAAARCGCCQ